MSSELGINNLLFLIYLTNVSTELFTIILNKTLDSIFIFLFINKHIYIFYKSMTFFIENILLNFRAVSPHTTLSVLINFIIIVCLIIICLLVNVIII